MTDNITFTNLTYHINSLQALYKPIKYIRMCPICHNLLVDFTLTQKIDEKQKFLSFKGINIIIDDTIIGWKLEY